MSFSQSQLSERPHPAAELELATNQKPYQLIDPALDLTKIQKFPPRGEGVKNDMAAGGYKSLSMQFRKWTARPF